MKNPFNIITKICLSFAFIFTACLTVTSIENSQTTRAETGISLKSGNYERWIDRIDFKGEQYPLDFYDWLIENTDNDGENDALIDLSLDQYTALTITDTVSYNSQNESAEDVISKIYKENYNEKSAVLKAVFAAFIRDNPQVFWLSGSFYSSTNVNYEYTKDSITYNQKIFFKLKEEQSADYPDGVDVRLPVYASGELNLKEEIEKVENATEEILKGVEDFNTAFEKVRYFNKWLTENNCYATTITDDCRNSRSALLGHEGNSKFAPVCEGYAKAFKVLCDRVSIPCVLVTGSSKGEGHMWNNVQMENGKWYAVDVTWNDPVTSGITAKKSTNEREDYLLVGANTEIFDETFTETHNIENEVYLNLIAFTNGPLLNDQAYGKEEKVGEWDVSTINDASIVASLYSNIDELHMLRYKLIIRGNGVVKDFEETPWAEYSALINQIDFSDGIVGFGNNVFKGFELITEFEILNPNVTITQTTFSNCPNLVLLVHANSYINLNNDTLSLSVQTVCDYSIIEYDWDIDNLKCTAEATCPICDHNKQEESTVLVSYEGEFACMENYKTVYTAEFVSDLFTSQIKEDIGAIEQHTASGDLLYDKDGHFYKCKCGTKVDFTAHSFSDWQIVEEPTSTTDGKKVKICSCGYQEEEKINRTGAFSSDEATTKLLIFGVILLLLVAGIVSMIKGKR